MTRRDAMRCDVAGRSQIAKWSLPVARCRVASRARATYCEPGLRVRLPNKLFISYWLLSGYNMESKLATKLEFWLRAAAGKNTKSNQNHTFLSPRKYVIGPHCEVYFVIKLSNEARHCDETWCRGVSLHNEDCNDSFSTIIQRKIVFCNFSWPWNDLLGKTNCYCITIALIRGGTNIHAYSCAQARVL